MYLSEVGKMEESGGIIPFRGHWYRKEARSLPDLHQSPDLVSSIVCEYGGRKWRLVVLERENQIKKINDAAQPSFESLYRKESSGKMYEYLAIETNEAFEADRRSDSLPNEFTNCSWLFSLPGISGEATPKEKGCMLLKEGRLFQEIAARRSELEMQKILAGPAIQYENEMEPDFHSKVNQAFKSGTLTPLGEGAGDAMLLTSEEGEKLAVVKTLDGAPFMLNNKKNFAGIVNDASYRVNPDIPSYEIVQNEALAYRVSELCQLNSGGFKIPTTVMFIATRNEFYDLTDKLPEEFRQGISKKRLCSVQKFVADSEDLQSFQTGKNSEYLAESFEQESFERANILSWITYENDGHMGNYRVYQLESGKMGLVKIDNGQCFPDKNSFLDNRLSLMKNAEKPLSVKGKEIIAKIPVADIVYLMRLYGKSKKCQDAFLKRIEVLKEVAKLDNVTIKLADQLMARVLH
jgi:hypothetical protein